MHEITELADECTVFCNGRSVASFAAGTKTDNEIVELMIGREYNAAFPPRTARMSSDAAPLLEVRHLGWTDRLTDISLRLSAGEVIGLGGLDGQGQRELLLALFGVLLGTTGEVLIDGRPVAITGPHIAKGREIGMALIPEDRKTEGLMLPMSVRDNLTLAVLGRVAFHGILKPATERAYVRRAVRRLQIRTGRPSVQEVATLSGGNQQKVLIGRWLLAESDILLLYDITRGVDVGTKHDIYELIMELIGEGKSLLFYSSETEEMARLCHRVLVMREGRIAAELAGATTDAEAIVAASLREHAA
jgi:ribose transport system ATP-binding protein